MPAYNARDQGQHPEINPSDGEFEYYKADTCCFPFFANIPLRHTAPKRIPISLPFGTVVHTETSAPRQLITETGNTLDLDSLYYVPNFDKKLLSIHQVVRNNECTATFTADTGYIVKGVLQPEHKNVLATMQVRHGIYVISLKSTMPKASASGIDTSVFTIARHTKPNIRRKPTLKTAPEHPGPELTMPNTPCTVITPAVPASKPRRKPTDKLTHTIPYSDYMPDISARRRRQLDIGLSWHIRLNHTAPVKLQRMSKLPLPLGLPREVQQDMRPIHCQGCSIAHFQMAPHTRRTPRTLPGNTIVTDISGPFPKTTGGYAYFITFTELYTRFTIVHLLKTQSEVGVLLCNVVRLIQRHFGRHPACITCDNANEYLTKVLLQVFAQETIQVKPTVPHSPLENAVADCINKTYMNRVRATLHTAALSLTKYWGFCLLDTVAKTNSTLHDTLGDIPRRIWNDLRDPCSPWRVFPLTCEDIACSVSMGSYQI